MADNTNVFNIAAAAALGADVTDSSYLEAPADCQYNTSGNRSVPALAGDLIARLGGCYSSIILA